MLYNLQIKGCVKFYLIKNYFPFKQLIVSNNALPMHCLQQFISPFDFYLLTILSLFLLVVYSRFILFLFCIVCILERSYIYVLLIHILLFLDYSFLIFFLLFYFYILCFYLLFTL